MASISQENLSADTAEEMVERIFEIMEQTLVYQPDIICLPEVFHTSNVKQKYTINEKVAISNNILVKMATFAKQNQCYLVVAVNTAESGKTFNSEFNLKTYDQHRDDSEAAQIKARDSQVVRKG